MQEGKKPESLEQIFRFDVYIKTCCLQDGVLSDFIQDLFSIVFD